MKQKISRFSIQYADAFLAAVLASFLIFLFTDHSGIGLSPDSIAYLSTAEHIANSFSFTDFSGEAFINFPLGYPIFLASTKWLFSFPLLNAILFSSILFISAAIMQQMANSNKLIRCCFLLFFACSAPLLEVYTMLWSETVFVFLSLLLMYKLHKYGRNTTTTNLIQAAIICSLTFFVRYAGIAFLLAGLAWILIMPNKLTKKLWHVFLFGVIGAVLPFVNLLRNLLITGTYTGVRQQAQRSLWDNILDTAGVINFWIPTSVSTAVIVFAIVILIAALLIITGFYKKPTVEILVSICFLAYCFFIITIASISRFEALSNRLWVPAFIPFFLLIYIVICKPIASTKKYVRYIGISLFIPGYIAAQYHQYQQNKASWEGVASAGIPGYSEDMWTNSALLSHIRKYPIQKNISVFSNANDALYFGTKHNARALPHKDIVEEINQYAQIKPVVLVWFFYGENNDLINLDKALENKTILQQYQFNDGLLIYCK